MNKMWDVVPAYGLSRYVAKMAFGLTGIVYCDAKKIEVKEAPSESVELGTQDGYTYTVYPTDRGCDCEPNWTCSNCAGYFTEKH